MKLPIYTQTDGKEETKIEHRYPTCSLMSKRVVHVDTTTGMNYSESLLKMIETDQKTKFNEFRRTGMGALSLSEDENNTTRLR